MEGEMMKRKRLGSFVLAVACLAAMSCIEIGISGL